MLKESTDIAFKIGQIQGTAQFITIVKSLERSEVEAALQRIYKWGDEIKELNKSLANHLVQESGRQ